MGMASDKLTIQLASFGRSNLHGGIGRSINHAEQVESIQLSIAMEAGSIVLMDWSLVMSDPTENDSVEGLRPNATGPGMVTFGVHFPEEFFFLSLFGAAAD